MYKLIFFVALLFPAILIVSCKKEDSDITNDYTYYLVGFDTDNTDWRDTAFVVRTREKQLIKKADDQLKLPVEERQIVFGNLVAGDGGFNKNALHSFKWHYKDDWSLVDITAEIYDGKPFTDIDSDTEYWLNTVKRFGAWSSHLKRKLAAKP